jgi:hypothetical protein
MKWIVVVMMAETIWIREKQAGLNKFEIFYNLARFSIVFLAGPFSLVSDS